MWVELPKWWIAVLNIVSIPTLHLGISWIYTKLPRSFFRPESLLFRERSWETRGKFYQSVFRIRQWKAVLPDAAPWFDGFAKGSLSGRDAQYLQAFQAETCRGEAAHYAQWIALSLTILWNPWPTAALIMLVYAVLSNLPCILLQRFTRARLRHLAAQSN